MKRTITLAELDLTITYSVKDDSPRGCHTVSGAELKVGDEIVIDNHFHEIIDSDDADEWENTEKTVTLTNAQWNTLSCYILMTTQYRKRELEAWEALSKETNEDGIPKFKLAADNASYYRELEPKLEAILKAIDN